MTFPILASLLVRLDVLLPFQLLRLSLASPSRWTPLALSVLLHCLVGVLGGAAKRDEEMRYGRESDGLLFKVESEAELHALAEVVRVRGRPARVALRVNPGRPPKTHVKTDTSVKGTKCGLDIDSLLE